jgi:hypothetical protein
MPEPGAVTLPKVGTSVGYFASPATAAMPATIAQDLGSGRYNLRVLGIDGNAFAKPNVLFIDVASAVPDSGEYCMLPRQL